jgi:hypothetical protein
MTKEPTKETRETGAKEPKAPPTPPPTDWAATLETIHTEDSQVARIVMEMEHAGENFCVFLGHEKELARGASKENMQEAVDACVAAWEAQKPPAPQPAEPPARSGEEKSRQETPKYGPETGRNR